jgi:hypothetical protein
MTDAGGPTSNTAVLLMPSDASFRRDGHLETLFLDRCGLERWILSC